MPLPHSLENALYGACATSVLLHADELGVFARLCAAGEPLAVGSLAASLATDEGATERLLRAACCLGLLRCINERFVLAEGLQPFLNPESAAYVGPLLSVFRTNTTRLLPYLADAVRTGSAQWARLGGESTHSPFDEIYRSPESAHQFLDAMWQLGYEPAKQLAAAPFLRRHETLVDVGGATGSFAFAAAQENPALSATVFDLPVVQPHFQKVAERLGLEGRVRFVSGDFWQDLVPPGDLYALGYILSDLDDQKSVALLSRLYQALPRHGRVVVLERLLDDNRTGPRDAVMQDIAMLLETGGRHRTAAEYQALLHRAGFRECDVFRSSGDKHMVFGVKV